MGAATRYILVVAHTGRQDSLDAGVRVCTQLLEAGVIPVLSADERRDLLAAEPGNPAPAVRAQPRLLRRDPGAAGGEELADLLFRVHEMQRKPGRLPLGGPCE